MSKNNLKELAEKYGTDKLEHGYIDSYSRYFGSLKEDAVNLLEIGVRYGDSVWMWHDYFRNGTIYGMDILNNAGYYKKFHKTYFNEKKNKHIALWPHEETGDMLKFDHLPNSQKAILLEETKNKILDALPKERFSLTIGDQSNLDDLANVVSECKSGFDIIIDDGLHAAAHQQISLGFLFKHRNPGGIYVIEDLHMGTERDEDPWVDSTNKVLKAFKATGKFSNQCTDEYSYLEENIAEVEWTLANEKICFIKKAVDSAGA